MNDKLKGALKLIFSLSIGIFLVYWSWNKLTPDQQVRLLDAVQQAKIPILLTSILFGVLSHVSRAYRWRMMLQPLGHNPSLHNTFFAVMIMYFFNLLFPRLGEVSRCSSLAAYEKVPLEHGIGTMIAERLLDVVILLFVGLLTFVVEFDVFLLFFDQYVAPILEKVIGGLNPTKLIVIGVLMLLGAAGLFWLFKKSSGKIADKLKGIIRSLADGGQSILKVKNLPAFVGHTLFIWLMYWAMTWIVFFALPFTSHLGAGEGLMCLFFGSFAMIATQGGIGAYPIIISLVLMLYGVDEVDGLAFGWVVFATQNAMVLSFGLLSTVLIAMLNKKVNLKVSTEV